MMGRGGGGGGSPCDFFGFEILAKSDSVGSMKDAGIFFGCEKRIKEFFGFAKKVVTFLSRHILKL